MESKKIKPIPHYSTTILRPKDFQTLHKRKESLQAIVLKIDLEDIPLFPQDMSQIQHKIIKAVKKLKYLKRAQFAQKDPRFSRYFQPSKYLYIIKHIPLCHSITIRDECIESSSFLNLTKWLKPAKELKSISYIMTPKIKLSDEKSNRIAHLMNIFQPKDLNIIDLGNWRAKMKSLPKVPHSLQSLKLVCNDKSSPEGPINTLSHLTELRELAMKIQQPNGIMLILINSIPNFANLTTLCLTLSEQDLIQDMTPVLRGIEKAKKLKRLHLKFIFKVEKLDETLSKVFEAVKDCPLTDLKLDIDASECDPLHTLAAFLYNSTGLEALHLNINTSHLNQILAQTLLPALKHIVACSKQLQKFWLVINYFGAPELFIDLFDALVERSPVLKELGLATGIYKPSDHQFTKILKLLENFKELKIIYLQDLCIPDEGALQRMLDIFYPMKKLQEISLGSLLAINSPSLFILLIENILSKRGLESFYCHYLAKSAEDLLKNSNNLRRIDLEAVRQKNPYLYEFPRTIRMCLRDKSINNYI